jgi:predicted chitinase
MSHQRELFSMQSQSQSSSSSSSSSSGLWGAAANTQAQNDPMELANANAAPTLAEIEGGAVLDQGHTGPAVAWVQGALNRLGYPVAQSGTFGSMTIGLLRQFQQTNKVAATGQVGPTTLSRLQAAVEASVSIDELAQLAPGVDRATLVEYLPHLNAAMLQHGITSDARKAAFLAQLGHESDGFHTLEEYASGSAYEGRSDLGNVFAGDGRRFKGRGPIQITGRYNYKQYGEKLGVDLIANPELAATPELGFQIAGQYWADHGLNELADSGHFDTITSRINGGQNGRTDRRRRWGQAQDVLAQSAGKPKVSMPETLTQTPSPAPALASGQTLFASHNSTPGTTGPAATGDAQSTSSPQLTALCSLIGKDDATMARSAAARFAAERRAQLGMANDSLTRAAGEVWQAADDMVHAQAALQEGRARDAQEAAHKAANALRALRDEGLVDAAAVDPAVARAGRIWTQANALSQQNAETNGQAHSGYAVWTTGRPGGRGGVTSRELNRNGDWDQNNWLSHHSDRSSSWAANNIRNGKNQDLQAYDFTFERQNARGEGIAGSAQGLELISPWDAKVHDVNPHFYGSGGYGKFIALEDLETGLRFEVHHLDSVADVRRGETLDGGDVIGTQGASGSSRYDYATHVDIVGTPEAVEQFVRANQSGRFKSNKKRGGAV